MFCLCIHIKPGIPYKSYIAHFLYQKKKKKTCTRSHREIAKLMNFTDYGHIFSLYFKYLTFLLPFRPRRFILLVFFLKLTVIRC